MDEMHNKAIKETREQNNKAMKEIKLLVEGIVLQNTKVQSQNPLQENTGGMGGEMESCMFVGIRIIIGNTPSYNFPILMEKD